MWSLMCPMTTGAGSIPGNHDRPQGKAQVQARLRVHNRIVVGDRSLLNGADPHGFVAERRTAGCYAGLSRLGTDASTNPPVAERRLKDESSQASLPRRRWIWHDTSPG